MSSPYELTPWESASAEPSLLTKYGRLREVKAELIKALQATTDRLIYLIEAPDVVNCLTPQLIETIAGELRQARSAIARAEEEK